MKHFAAGQWADFVRGCAAPDLRHAMQQHIEAGCLHCARLVDSYRHVVDFAAAERSLNVPAAVLRRARALLSLWKPERLLAKRRSFARLVLDTLEPVPAGTRAPDAAGRQVVYSAGRYLLDFRREREPGSRNVLLVGQLFDSKDPCRRCPDVPAVLFSGRSIVARAVTNEFGEFQMEYRPRRALELILGLKGATASVTLAEAPNVLPFTRVRGGVAGHSGKGPTRRSSRQRSSR